MSPWRFIFLAVVLDILLDDQHFDHKHRGVHLHDCVHHDHAFHPVCDRENLKHFIMTNISEILGRHIDPGEPLSNKDLAIL